MKLKGGKEYKVVSCSLCDHVRWLSLSCSCLCHSHTSHHFEPVSGLAFVWRADQNHQHHVHSPQSTSHFLLKPEPNKVLSKKFVWPGERERGSSYFVSKWYNIMSTHNLAITSLYVINRFQEVWGRRLMKYLAKSSENVCNMASLPSYETIISSNKFIALSSFPKVFLIIITQLGRTILLCSEEKSLFLPKPKPVREELFVS